MKYFFLSAFVFLSLFHARAQSIPALQSLPYSQNFSSLAHSATSYPLGWQGWVVGTSPGTTYSTNAPSADRLLIANSGASTSSGNVHNYNGKIGMLNTGSLDLALALSLTTLGKENILLRFDAMTIRNPYDSTSNTRLHELGLQYRIGDTGAFANIPGAVYQNNTLKQNGSGITTPQNIQSFNVVLPSECDNKDSVQLRWLSRQVSGAGLRPSFAIDNINIDTASIMRMSLVKHAHESATPIVGQLKIDLSSATKHASSFRYRINGTATFGVDYSVSISSGAAPSLLLTDTGSILIDSAVSIIDVFFTPINDALVEGMERINFSIVAAIDGYIPKDSVLQVHLIDDEYTPIHLIQDTGFVANAGTYNVSAIVTGVFPYLSPSGFYIQEEDVDADTDNNTSEGIFVVSDSLLSVGDRVLLLADAYEGSLIPSYNQAVLIPSSLQIQSKLNPLPSATIIHLPLLSRNDLERYEGMLVHFADTLTVTDNNNLGKYGELTLSAKGNVYQPTQITDPNDSIATGTNASGTSNIAAIQAHITSNDLRSILLDDGRTISMTTLPYINTDNTLRVGSTIDSLWGIMGFAYDQYRLQPTAVAAVKIKHQPRPTVPDVGAAANIKVASFNVLNFFNGDGFGGGFPTTRGASSLVEFARQRDKIINAILAIDADIVGLIEIENDGVKSSSAIQNLVNGLNAYLGAGTYAIVQDGDSIQSFNTDEIRCGIIYKTAIVDTIGAAIIASDSIFNRPPLAQTFKVRSSDSVFTFIINHFKAKGCTSSKLLDKDQNDGQSCYNDTRKKQAAALVYFINNTIIPSAKSDKVLSMGDYNSYFEEDPLDTIRNSGFLILSKPESYSYLYQGQLGSLDNAFVNNSFLPFVTGIAKWNINSVEPSYLDYEDDINDGGGDQVNFWGFLYNDGPYRCSDHDPVLVGLQLGKKLSAPVLNIEPKADFELYPNPSRSVLLLSKTDGNKASVLLMNAMGQQLQNWDWLGKNTQINTEYLPSGLYFVKVLSTGKSYPVKRFVKE